VACRTRLRRRASAIVLDVFFFGLGYSSRATARWIHRLVAPDVPISGTVRSEAGAGRLRADGIAAHVFDGGHPTPGASADIRTATHVVQSIPPSGPSDPALDCHRAELDAAQDLQWIGYFSTVGVYGDAGGAWIDETAGTRPLNVRSQHRLAVEALWRDYARVRGVPLAILRLAGIYGPGRSAYDKLRAGTATRIVKPGQVFNRVHVEDVGHLTALAATRRLTGTFNVCDDEPAPPQDVTAYAATLAGLPVPEAVAFEHAEMSELARSFYADNKRCSNAAIKMALGAGLLYPTYREGLAAILQETG
jgi:dTDP-4-dehydrorhamnose reductase